MRALLGSRCVKERVEAVTLDASAEAYLPGVRVALIKVIQNASFD